MSMFDNIVFDEFTLLDEGMTKQEYIDKKKKEKIDKDKKEYLRDLERKNNRIYYERKRPKSIEKYSEELKRRKEKDQNSSEYKNMLDGLLHGTTHDPSRSIDSIDRHIKKKNK